MGDSQKIEMKPAFSTYQFEKRRVSLEEAQSVINRAYGSGEVRVASGQSLLDNMKWQQVWVQSHPDIKVFGGVPFYGPQNTPVAYEYFLQCGNEICGYLYDVFPGKKNLNDIMDLFIGKHLCSEKYICNGPINNPIGQDLSAYTFFVPDIVPISIRIAESFSQGKIQFYHGIYGIGEKGKVISLDKADINLSKSEIIARQKNLVSFDSVSLTTKFLHERAKVRDIPNGDMHETLVDKRNTERLYSCVAQNMENNLTNNLKFPCGFSMSALIFGGYTILNETIDMTTGRVYQGDPTHIPTYLDYPL
ncbi:MAG: hypothetical protein Q8K26_05155 [Candidatus Gracilibacteria bacterium]|nr:hypothetical protein [Candidatus Gracilibacteria bacterium]